ncbi:MAG: ABC transporter permease [Agathobacter sp.]
MTNLSKQDQYLKKQLKNKRFITMMRIIIFVSFFILWEVAAKLGWIDDFIFSSPSRILRTLAEMIADQTFFGHLSITLLETILSFLLVIVCTLAITILLWLNEGISKTVEPYLVVLNSLPKSALAPLLIVWLGANYRTIIVTGMSVAIFGSILSLYTNFMEVEPDKLKLIRTLGGNRKDILFKVMIPANIPNILSIMKVDIGLCLVGVIIGEFIASRQGLGYLIIYGSQVFTCAGILIQFVIVSEKFD